MSTEKKPEGKLLDHNYDGIQELDNPLPKWWVQLFYATIVFAILYFSYYTFGFGPSLAEAHDQKLQAMAAAKMAPKAEKEETAITFESTKEVLANGNKIYQSNCAACHKADGGGLIGPNLTDAYWIHGKGTNKDIYMVISNGVVSKGMIAWKDLLDPKEIEAVVVYIQSLKGSTPPNAKAAEGQKVH